ncbi:MAG: DNA alkylation repair protein [Elusimicrobiales bacterium]|nr:DNA alkylation repair protein [Elusimicrobiales bacterium]
MSLKELKTEFKKAADPSRARLLAGYFKTGKGEYAEGDRFLGLTVPAVRGLAKKYRSLPLADAKALLLSPWHEERVCALMLLEERFDKGTAAERKDIYDFYAGHTRFINNWDLVDMSAPGIVGGWLKARSRKPLYRLAGSKLLWERRIAILACFSFIKDGESADALALARRLLGDRHDLMHKAVGWMLREVGKRCSEKILLDFLKANYARLPRTTLRYAIEKFPAAERKALLAGKF